MGHDGFESDIALRLTREISSQSTSVAQERSIVRIEQSIKKFADF
jgi:hypothetical protein